MSQIKLVYSHARDTADHRQLNNHKHVRQKLYTYKYPMPRVVASLTTMPHNYDKLYKTILSLTQQTHKLDAIYLGLPRVSHRLKVPYPKLPGRIRAICTPVRCKDYGPITKLAALFREQDPDTIILTFDDDMYYPPTIVEALLAKHHLYPQSALGSSGALLKHPFPCCAVAQNENYPAYRVTKFHIPPEGRKVDSIYGYAGALYTRGMFPELTCEHVDNAQASSTRLEAELFNQAFLNTDMFLNDDIVISGYLSKRGIARRIFADIPEVGFTLNAEGIRARDSSEISYDFDKFFQRLNSARRTCISLGMYSDMEHVGWEETILGVGFVITLAVIFIVLISGGLIWFCLSQRRHGLTR